MRPESDYLYVEIAAQRCLQLMRGARPKIDANVRKYTTLAIREVAEADVPWEIRPETGKEKEIVSEEAEAVEAPDADAEASEEEVKDE